MWGCIHKAHGFPFVSQAATCQLKSKFISKVPLPSVTTHRAWLSFSPSPKAEINLSLGYYGPSCYILKKKILEYNCFTMLYLFLLYNEENQLYVYIYPLPLGPPFHPHPTPLGLHRVLTELSVQYSSFPLAIYFIYRSDWATSLSLFTFMHWRRKWRPTPVFLPGESQGWRSLVGCRLWGRTESDTTEAT